MDIGDKIKKFRKKSGMEQKELARRLNISPKTVSSWEVNRTQPKMEMIEAMCKIFQCRKSDFLDVDSGGLRQVLDAQDIPPDRVEIFSRLINLAMHCSMEELEAIITILERSIHSKED